MQADGRSIVESNLADMPDFMQIWQISRAPDCSPVIYARAARSIRYPRMLKALFHPLIAVLPYVIEFVLLKFLTLLNY